MKEKYEQEKELKDTLWCIYECIEIPDSTDSWKRVQKRIENMKRRRLWRRRIKIGTTIATVFFILILLLNQPLSTAHSQIGTLFKKWKEEVIDFFDEPREQDKAHSISPSVHNGVGSGSVPMQINL